MGQEVKHNRFYIDLGNWEDTQQTLEYLEGIALKCSFPIYATLQQIKLLDDKLGFRVGLAHRNKQALLMFPARWMLALQDKRVPMGYADNDEIAVNNEVNWMVKDINPGLIEDYNQQG